MKKLLNVVSGVLLASFATVTFAGVFDSADALFAQRSPTNRDAIKQARNACSRCR